MQASQQMRAFRGARAVSNAKYPLGGPKSGGAVVELSVAMMDQRRMHLKQRHDPIDLDQRWYQPKARLGHLRAVIEDELHKLKRLRAAINSQREHAVDSDDAKAVVVSRHRILEVCASVGPELDSVKKALLHPDTQNTAVCEHLAMDALLQEKLRAAGYEKDALVLKLIGEGFAAFEHCGSTTEERMQKLSARRDLLVSLYGHRIYHPYMAEQSRSAQRATASLGVQR
jgi:hypothetical protein